jgi:3-methyladenine DNA glycosylase/8-oxoguanine DNA glycosylase
MKSVTILNDHLVSSLYPTAPFSFDGTFHKPSHFPTPDNSYEQGIYWQTLRFNDEFFGLKFVDVGTVDKPEIELSVYFDTSQQMISNIDLIKAELTYRFDLERDLSSFIDSLSKDSTLSSSLHRWRGMRVGTPYSLYEFLVVTTVLQNTTIHRTVQMMTNLFQEYGTLLRYDDKDLCAFWAPEKIKATSESKLRELKVGYRAKTFKRQADEFTEEWINEPALRFLSKDDLKTRLLEIYGVGPATIQYLLFEVFHYFDVCEKIPPWEQKIYSRLLFNQDDIDSEVILDEITKRWGKWRMLAMHYLFENLFWLRKTERIDWLEALILL